MPTVAGKPLYSLSLAAAHLALQVAMVIIVVSGFFLGNFSGREYLEFPSWVIFIIVAYWVMFGINFFKTVKPKLAVSPVYIWSWASGLLFFLITIIEAHLWVLPYFNDNIIRDVTVQWKANGSMVGAWNLLIFGTAMYAMERITGDTKMAHHKMSFAFYFLGLANLMFNWGHHTYIVPANPVIKQVSYIISMTELILLANIIIKWRKSYRKKVDAQYHLAYNFFRSADTWILLNLVLAIAISVPYINKYTHGTQITVAHAMGATIGINTMLLFASVSFIFEHQLNNRSKKTIGLGLKIMNISLFLFWTSLISAGIVKSISIEHHIRFGEISLKLQPYLRFFSASGIFLITGIFLVAFPIIKIIFLNKHPLATKSENSISKKP